MRRALRRRRSDGLDGGAIGLHLRLGSAGQRLHLAHRLVELDGHVDRRSTGRNDGQRDELRHRAADVLHPEADALEVLELRPERLDPGCRLGQAARELRVVVLDADEEFAEEVS